MTRPVALVLYLLLASTAWTQGVFPGGVSSASDVVIYNQSGLAATTTQTSVEEVMLAVPLPANALGLSSPYSGFEWLGTIEHAANTHSAVFMVKVGGISGTQIATTTGTTSGNQHQVHFWCQVSSSSTLNCQGTNSQKTGSSFLFGAVAVGGLDFTAPISLAITGTTTSGVGDVYVSSMRIVLLRRI